MREVHNKKSLIIPLKTYKTLREGSKKGFLFLWKNKNVYGVRNTVNRQWYIQCRLQFQVYNIESVHYTDRSTSEPVYACLT